MNEKLIPIARSLSAALLSGRKLKFHQYVGSESTAAYDIVVEHEAYAAFTERKRAAAEKLKDQCPATEDQAAAKAALLADWTGNKEAGAYRGPVYELFTLGEETFGGCIFICPGKEDRFYVRDIRQVEKTLIAGAEKVTNSRPLTLAKAHYTKLLLDDGKPHLFQLTVTEGQKIEVL